MGGREVTYMYVLSEDLFLQPRMPTALMETFVWQMEGISLRGEWRCVCMDAGGPCVMTCGMEEMLLWFADN